MIPANNGSKSRADVRADVNNETKIASSAESVGGFRFRQSSKCVIEGHFHRFEGAKSVRSSGDHSNLVVETLDRAAGKLAFGPAVRAGAKIDHVTLR